MSKLEPDGHQVPEPPVDLVRMSPPGERLSPFMVLLFYSQGTFPWMFNQNHQQLWWCFEPRSVLFVKNLRINRTLRKVIRRGRYRVTADTAFDEVVKQCRETRQVSWITEDMSRVFNLLHRHGHAHSLEVWEEDKLVGGLFGTAVGQMFSGASMFSSAPSASQVALVALCRFFEKWDVPLIDCQVQNPYLVQMGSTLIKRDAFREIVGLLTKRDHRLGPWTRYFR